MILPLLHERSCKKKITHHSNNNKRTWKKKHPPQQQQRNEPRKQTPTTTTTTTKNLENKHPPKQQQQGTWKTNTHPNNNNNNNKELGKQTPTPTNHPPPPPPPQQQKEVREEDFVFERKIFKNLCTRIAGWTSKCDGEWAHHGLGLFLLLLNQMGPFNNGQFLSPTLTSQFSFTFFFLLHFPPSGNETIILIKFKLLYVNVKVDSSCGEIFILINFL